MPRLILGILTLYLNDAGVLEERRIYEQMTIEGDKLDIQVIVFTPSDVLTKRKKVKAHIYDLKNMKWIRQWVAIPNLIFDRCRIQKSHRMKELRVFKSSFSNLHYLNRPLGNKWTMHQKLLTSPFIKKYLPHTIKYEKNSDLIQMLKKYNVVYVKPVNGTGGRGILRIERHTRNNVKVQGRDHNRRIISPRTVSIITLKDFINKWNVTATSYLVQEGIPLTLSNGRVHDYRILVQKDGNGSWMVTGGAGRIGAARSITANLHGGGSAVAMTRLMQSFVNVEVDLSRVQEEINTLAIELASFLEGEGYQLCELAIDLAIDRDGGIWIIELNPKPSREVFREIGELERYFDSIRRPLEYAKYEYLYRLNQ
ncbi:YheC/YheD family protein [Paenibacillus camelliae]|uniref:YheC/YheD family endospore coat-associated protein n=1 Tax=Paenibacillus camelliae TaxID=512410 RepID=UPI002040A720|nr:YheC/YheD family protein [Paenibacillus camelliae]MCM3632532.1 YheC/YheD family protein [Paenibacillus camelliae]